MDTSSVKSLFLRNGSADREMWLTMISMYLTSRMDKVIAVDIDNHETINMRFVKIEDGRAYFSVPLESVNGADDELY